MGNCGPFLYNNIMNGERLIEIICKLLDEEGSFHTDTNIIQKLRTLSYVELHNLYNIKTE